MSNYPTGAAALLIALGMTGQPVLAGTASDVSGMFAGRVVDHLSQVPVDGATVRVLSLGSERGYEALTDEAGTFFVPELPADLYRVQIVHGAASYDVDELFDVRMGMRFVLENCFEVDAPAGSAFSSNQDVPDPVRPGRARRIVGGPTFSSAGYRAPGLESACW